MSETALSVRQLNRYYGDLAILEDVNFSVERGEVVGLVGDNGAGKTTLIKSILDFISVGTGEITIFGKSHNATNARAAVSFLPEKFSPPHYLTGQNFLQYMSELKQAELREEDIVKIFAILDLDRSALKKSVRQYSRGMAQKLGLASCLLSQSPLLLFDEPMSGLDPKARAYLKRYFLILKEVGTTIFFSTHFLANVESICDRIIILNNRRVAFNGTPTKCCEAYNKSNLEDAYLSCIDAVPAF